MTVVTDKESVVDRRNPILPRNDLLSKSADQVPEGQSRASLVASMFNRSMGSNNVAQSSKQEMDKLVARQIHFTRKVEKEQTRYYEVRETRTHLFPKSE